jgi:N-methylhydantoinase B/oxoprolinase/acetone carboxylase alpha subunit
LTEPGTIVNVRHPGPSVGGNTETHPHIQNVVVAALSQAVPERAAAAEGATACNFLFGGIHPETGEYYTNYHFEGCGWGATVAHDGNSVMCPVNGNCRNTPIEVFETKYPFLTLEYSMRRDSGGRGMHRGGLGSARKLRVMAPEITVSALLDRTRTHAWGLFGGSDGASARLMVKKKDESQFRSFSDAFGVVCATKFTRVVLKEGDEVIIESPGGGGYGPPEKRLPSETEEDLRQGYISPQAR